MLIEKDRRGNKILTKALIFSKIPALFIWRDRIVGLVRALGKRVYRKVSRVRIPLSPPNFTFSEIERSCLGASRAKLKRSGEQKGRGLWGRNFCPPSLSAAEFRISPCEMRRKKRSCVCPTLPYAHNIKLPCKNQRKDVF